MIRTLLISATVASLAVAAPAYADPIHVYNFDSDLSDSLGGAALSTSFQGTGSGSVSGGFYNFTAGGGLALTSGLPGSVYTIQMRVALNERNGYSKLISFENLTSDQGLYRLDGKLNLYNFVTSPTTDFTPGVFTDVQISRDSAGLVTGYINGVQKLSYADTSNYFTAASSLYFLRDDMVQNGEQAGGQLDFLRIYDTAVPTDSVPGTPGAVPEPASWAMMLFGFGAVGGALRRRKVRIAYA
jgi:hypothetical protein